jgi:hypothetical protein
MNYSRIKENVHETNEPSIKRVNKQTEKQMSFIVLKIPLQKHPIPPCRTSKTSKILMLPPQMTM